MTLIEPTGRCREALKRIWLRTIRSRPRFVKHQSSVRALEMWRALREADVEE